MPRLFDAFFTSKSKGMGMGLGLAIVRLIVENRWATRNPDGRGDYGIRLAGETGCREPELI
jgi:C4-dicarboxylate-specific signal transduction histidine kinase